LIRDNAPLVVWWLSALEIRSAVARLLRDESIDLDGRERSLRLLTSLQQQWREVLPSDDVRRLAERLCEQYPLRAADAVQLAAALAWCRERPRGRKFICFDLRLAAAAEQAGFQVEGGPGWVSQMPGRPG